MDGAYKISGPHIVSDVLQGEAVVLNLTTDDYYRMAGSAAVVWGGIQQQLAVSDLIARVCTAYDGDPMTIETAVDDFLHDLIGYGLIVPADAQPATPFPHATQKLPFVAPRATRYDGPPRASG